ncbi:MAG TPA: response regulator transcription factor [bacterium]|nr:response regulator transcription factor [bacterium]
MRILVVEDDRKVARFIGRALEEAGYAVDQARTGTEGLTLAADRVHDLVILDVLLPEMNGFQVLRAMRQQEIKTPVLLLTARDTVEDKVRGLDSGADDYLTKPFAVEEMLARVRALLRRGESAQPALLKVDRLVLDPATRTVCRDGNRIELTIREYALLEYFMRHPGQVLTRTMIAEHVWNYNFDTMTNVIDVYVNYLRKKIDSGPGPRLLHAVRGVGYVLKAET